MSTPNLNDYLESLRLGKDIFEVMVDGRSAIDVRRGPLSIISPDEAALFIKAYGYNMEEPIESAELLGIYHESIRFIKKYFLQPENPEGLAKEIPSYFLQLTDFRKLLIYSTNQDTNELDRSHWACAILSIMHTIVHLNKDIHADFFSTIQQQVCDRFYKEIYNQGDKVYLGPPKSIRSVPLVKFQTKPRKMRDSQILKMLHKEENVAENIYDQVGVRFVTHTRTDALRVLKYLRENYIIIPGNIKPSRSRNNLVDPLLYRRVWRGAKSEAQKDLLRSTGEINTYIERELQSQIPKKTQDSNPFSNDTYAAIQFTCRQLIKYKNSAYDDIKNLKTLLRETSDEKLKKYADRIDINTFSKERPFFYSYEVQIMDERSFEESQVGAAAHKNYRAAQIQQAMKRILHPFFDEKKSQEDKASFLKSNIR